DGATEIQNLAIGDLILTAKGEAKAVKWIGRRQCERASTPDAAPVKIARFAIDGTAPTADLYVSPGHAIYVDGMLIPVVDLVNGSTIQADAKPEIQTITYYHVELDTHEVILAEGLPTESFLGDNRAAFENADEYIRLYGSHGSGGKPESAQILSLSRFLTENRFPLFRKAL
ncbi:MAG: Hint domain-containing protein, partial [Alphaproteobacteria bacterium]